MEHRSSQQDRVEADVSCLMCGRTIGRLFGLAWRSSDEPHTVSGVVQMAFRPSSAAASGVAVSGSAQLRCPDCSGIGVVEEFVVARIQEAVKFEYACPIHGDALRGRGRPARGCRCGTVRPAA
jgi:hypothetical protein